jgi:hypothetical protein
MVISIIQPGSFMDLSDVLFFVLLLAIDGFGSTILFSITYYVFSRALPDARLPRASSPG